MHSATAPILLLPASLDSVPASPYVPSHGLKIIQSHMAAADRWVVWPYLARSGGVEDLSVLYSGKQSWVTSTAVKAMTSDWIVCLVKREVQFWLLLSCYGYFINAWNMFSVIFWAEVLKYGRQIAISSKKVYDPMLPFPHYGSSFSFR